MVKNPEAPRRTAPIFVVNVTTRWHFPSVDIPGLQAARLAGSGGGDDPFAERPTVLELEGVTKVLGRGKNARIAVNEVDLTVREGEFITILGPRGSGKTTLLRLIAGLDVPDPGAIFIEGNDCSHWPAHRRPVNTVFKEFGLFPHLTVSENIGFGLRMKRRKSHEVAREVMGAMQLLNLVDVAALRPAKLDRGQHQRVALARALVCEPTVLLLDEPLDGLDIKLRRELLGKLRELQSNLAIPFILFTEDQEEALSLSDTVVVMNEGRFEQIGPPAQLYEYPANPFVAGFVGNCNLINGRFLYREGAEVVVDTALGKVNCYFPESDAEKADQNEVTLAIRPEKVIAGDADATVNQFTGTIVEIDYQGSETRLQIRHNETLVRVNVPNPRLQLPNWKTGDAIPFSFPPDNLILMDAR